MKKVEIIEKLDHIKSILISAATYGTSEDKEYILLRNELMKCEQIKPIIPILIKSNRSTSEARSYMQGLYGDYVNRRRYITEEINKVIVFIEEYCPDSSFIKYDKTGWERIDESVALLKESLDSVSDRISFNEIGVRCRETIIMLANQVYIDSIHHPKEYPGEISRTDAQRKFDGYFDWTFPGSKNEEKRSYAKSCNKLANYLTHSQTLSKIDAKLCIVATVSLIQLIKTINQEQNH